MKNNRAFCKSNYRLPQIRCQEWLGWIMVTLNADAPPVAHQLAEIESLVEDYGMTGYVEAFQEK